MRSVSLVVTMLMALCTANMAYATPCPSDFDCDGTPDASDGCPQDYFKTAPGACGCSYGEGAGDSDSDSVVDCLDYCWWDPGKQSEPQTLAPACGCGYLDDNDSDGYLDCGEDECIMDPHKHEAGVCGCHFLESFADQDSDGTLDCYDECPFDAQKTLVGLCGCGVADVDTDGDQVYDCDPGEQCPSDPNKLEPGECGCGVPEGTC